MNHPLAELVLESSKLWPIGVALAILLALGIWRLYWPQVRLLMQPWRWLLPGLRSAALVCLALSLLKPIAIHAASDRDEGPILILIDRSRSMSEQDLAFIPQLASDDSRYQPAISRLVGMADALGIAPAGTRDPALAGLRDDLAHLRILDQDLARARGELDFAQVSGQGVDSAQARFEQANDLFKSAVAKVDTLAAFFPQDLASSEALNVLIHPAARAGPDRALAAIDTLIRWADDLQIAADVNQYQSDQAVRAACQKLAEMSRFGRVEFALTDPGAGLLGKIPATIPLFGYTFAEENAPIGLRRDGEPIRRLLVEPDMTAANLPSVVRTTLGRFSGQPLRAVVVISSGDQAPADGADNAAISAADVPLFAVDAAAPAPVDDPANPSAMKRFADSVNGHYLDLDQIGSLPEMISRNAASQNRLVRNLIWDSPYLYALVVSCFSAEWAIRKKVGLV